ncbi:MAG: hypothetical protein SFY66_01150 [Oculatellaceae cyanobacterium bins.114]|nr:hypothetical protein [Oculatellaceae cyanobacterium bins.114]
MAQTLMLGKLSDSPPPHRVWLRLYSTFDVDEVQKTWVQEWNPCPSLR